MCIYTHCVPIVPCLHLQDYDRVSSDIRRLQSTGLAHEWCIPRCLHRIRYLSMSTEACLQGATGQKVSMQGADKLNKVGSFPMLQRK